MNKLENRIAKFTTRQLLALFNATEKGGITIELAMVREALMNELERRDPEAFNNWLDSDEDSPSKFFK